MSSNSVNSFNKSNYISEDPIKNTNLFLLRKMECLQDISISEIQERSSDSISSDSSKDDIFQSSIPLKKKEQTNPEKALRRKLLELC